MNPTAILHPIGKWQITIPLAWRKKLGIDRVAILARLEKNRIILEQLPEESLSYDIELISLNTLDAATKKQITESQANYRAWKTENFLSHNDFWDV